MSKAKIEQYIPVALKVLSREFPNAEIPSAYNGYISSFGASVLQSGLKPTLALFENKSASTKEDKSFLTKIILEVLDASQKQGSLLLYVLDNEKREEYLKQEIIDIAIAIKLSIRTFKLV